MVRKGKYNNPFVKMLRSEETKELMKDKNCFMLLTQIAFRAKRTNGFSLKNHQPGEAEIGDHKNIGLSAQEYRTAKAKLAEWGFATFKPTNRGTIARLIDTRVFDVNINDSN